LENLKNSEELENKKIKDVSEKIVLDNLKKFAKVVDERFPALITKKDIESINARMKMLFVEVESIKRKMDYHDEISYDVSNEKVLNPVKSNEKDKT
jgi:formamidopyrimidine-DNA glycosylase